MAVEGVGFSAAFGDPGSAWDQGDIVAGAFFYATDELLPAILVTPACDLEQDKVGLWTFIALLKDDLVAAQLIEPELKGWNIGANAIGKGQRGQLAKVVRNLVTQRFPRFHWLPLTLGDHTGFVADFTLVQSLPAAEVREKATRVTRLRPSWREQLPTRYAAYMGRIGPDDFDHGSIDDAVEAALAGALGHSAKK